MAYIVAKDLISFTRKFIDEDDTDAMSLMTSYCQSAIDAVKKYLGYDPEEKEYTTEISGENGTMLALEAQPISEIKAVKVDGYSVDVDTVKIVNDNQNYIRMKDNSFFCREYTYTINYVAGFETVPQLIKLTALQIASLFMESSGGNLAVSSTSFADAGTRVFNNFTMDRFLKQIEDYKMVIR